MWRVNEDLTRALPICAGYDLPAQREECAVGAVMEWVYASQRAAVLDRPQDAPLPAVSQPLELCELADGPLSPGCVEGAVTAVGPEQVDETIDWCLARPEVLQACTHSLARRVVQMEINENQPVLGRASAICERLSSSPGNTYCSESFGYMLLFLRRDLDMTKDFCASLSVLQVDGCMRGIERVREYARAVGDSSLMFPE
jgi:hypothetical protein